tara:strand:+ start:2631 stop:2993 length:363 start_codon:yes stop_codon:yes gene_type:complete
MKKTNDNNKARLFLRIGLALVFLYVAIAAFISPGIWSTFLPSWISSFINPLLFLKFYSSFEIFLAFWLLSNKKIFYASVISTIIISGVILTNINYIDVIFRDFAILFSAVALTYLSKEKK